MVAANGIRLQLRLIACHVIGVLAEFIAMPYLLTWGLEMANVVLAWLVGIALFLLLAIPAGLVWRRSIEARPVRSALAAPIVLMLAIYILLRSLSGFEPGDARMALDIAIVGGVCAFFSSACFLVWTALASGKAATEPNQAAVP